MAVNVAVGLEIKAGVSGTQAVDQLNDKLKKLASTADISAGQIKQAYRQLPAQFTDIATSLAGGQSPFMVLLQQGGQIRDQFGGIGTALRAVGSFLTPVTVGVGLLAGAVGTLAAAFYAGSEEAVKFAKAVALTGGAAGVTFGAMNAAAKELADTTDIGIGAAKGMMNGLIAAGISGAQGLQPLASAMSRLQKLSGASTEDITKDFASMSRGVAAWAADHNRQYNFVTAAQYEMIRTLEKQGEAEKAMALTGKLLDDALKSRVVELGYLEQAWDELGKAASKAWDWMKGVGRPDTNQSLLAAAEAELASLEQRLELTRDSIYGRSEIPDTKRQIAQAKADIATLREAINRENSEAAASAKKLADERAKIDEVASGRAEAKLEAGLKKQSQMYKNASEATIRGFEEQSLKLDLLRAADIITEKDFQAQKSGIEAQILQAKIALLDQEIGIERQRKVFGADQIEQETKILAMLGQRREMLAKIRNLPLQAEINSAKDETAERKRIDAEAKEAAKARESRNKTEIDSIEKMRVERAAEIDQLALQGQAINMSAHEFEVLTEARRTEMEISRAVVSMLPENAAAYRAVAEEAANTAAAIREANYQQSRTFEFGAKQAFKNYLDDVGNVAKSTEQLFSNAFKGMEDAMVNFAMTGKLNFRDLANSIIEDMIRIMIQQSIMGPLMSVLGSLVPGAAPAASGVVSGGSGFKFNAMGGVYGSDVAQAFANGGAFTNSIVNKPTLFPFAKGTGLMGESGPEAIMPLARTTSGKLGVMTAGSGASSGDTSVVVHVNVEAGSEKVSSNQGASALGKIIAGTVREELIKQKRPGGLLAA